jgi:hypothetical protein
MTILALQSRPEPASSKDLLMTSASLSRRLAVLATIAASLTLAACGGGGGSGNGTTNIRPLNLTADLPTVDLYTGDTKQFGTVATDTLGTYAAIEANTYTLNVKNPGDSSTLLTGSYSLAKDAHYTAIVWGRQTALRLSTLPEDEDSANITDSANTRVRMFNATTDTGTVDVFITAATPDLGETAATQSALASGALSGFREIAAGTYRLRITGAGDPTDLRLDIPSITLSAKKFNTIVLTAGSGGVLVNATQIEQQGTAKALKNTKARVRVVASVDLAGNVASTFGSTTLVASLRSPSVGPYALVDAGTNTLTMRINGSPYSTATRTFAAGADYTLIAYGTAAAGKLVALTDDNRLPSSSTKTKIRLVNGVASADPLTLSIDYLAVASDIAAGATSAYSTVNANTSAQVQVTSATAAEPLYQTTTTTPLSLVGQGIYSVFMLSGSTTTGTPPTGIVRRER